MFFLGPELFMMFILLVGQTGGDLLDLISTDAYWRNKNVTVSIEQLRRDAGPDAPIANVEQLIKDLSAEEFPIRNKARQKLQDMGPAIIPQLKPATESTDSEVAAAAQQIVQQLSARAQARQIRRLMAIRTLGERKEATAAELLHSLAESKEPFVADYARRALAQIDGKPYAPPFDEKAFAADLHALPQESRIAAQFRCGSAGQRITIDSLAEEMLKAAADQAGGAADAPAADQPKVPDQRKFVDHMTAQLLKLLEAVGNIRLDAVTVGTDVDAEGDNGFAAVVLRGRYNPQAVMDFVRTSAAGMPGANIKLHKVDDIDFIDLDRGASAALVSPERIVIVGGPRTDGHAAAVSALIKRLAPVGDTPSASADTLRPPAGTPAATRTAPGTTPAIKGGLADNEQMAPLLKGIDKGAAAWVCGFVPKGLHNEKAFSGFDTFLAQGFREKDSLRFAATGTGTDPDKVKASADAITEGLQQALVQVKQEAARRKSLAAVVTMFESIKCVPDGKSAALTGAFTSDIITSFLQETEGMGLFGNMDDDTAVPDAQPPEEVRELK